MSSLDIIRGRQVVVPLTNRSGAAVAAGDVVVIGDGTNDKSFTTTTTPSFNSRMVGIAQEAIANAAEGRVLIFGYAPIVNSAASLTRDHFLFTSSTAKEATGSGTRAAGAFGQVIETGTDPEAVIWGMPDAAAAGGGGTFSGARLTHATQNINTATITALTWDTEAYDTDSYHEGVTNPTRITIPANGKYRVSAGGWFGFAVSNELNLWIGKNGTSAIASGLAGNQIDGPSGKWISLSFDVDLVSTDYIVAYLYHDNGATRAFTLGYFTIQRLDP